MKNLAVIFDQATPEPDPGEKVRLWLSVEPARRRIYKSDPTLVLPILLTLPFRRSRHKYNNRLIACCDDLANG